MCLIKSGILNPSPPTMSELENILRLAAHHGLQLFKDMRVSDMGLDFRVVFATDLNQRPWVLRIPRRPQMDAQIQKEKAILQIVRSQVKVEVPDWQIADASFIAYPLLTDPPVLSYDAQTFEVTWHMDRNNPMYLDSLAQLMVQIHRISAHEAQKIGLDVFNPHQARQWMLDKLKTVESALRVPTILLDRWYRWIDENETWPQHTCFIHGDLFAGHIMSPKSGPVSGVIDWSEAQINDPSIDFAGHLLVFGEESLRNLLQLYQQYGGTLWPNALQQTLERALASSLNYAYFALEKGDEQVVDAAVQQMEAAAENLV
jgi:macrolide phosphotransferase